MIIEAAESAGFVTATRPRHDFKIIRIKASANPDVFVNEPGDMTLYLYETGSIHRDPPKPALVWLSADEPYDEKLQQRIQEAFDGYCVVLRSGDPSMSFGSLHDVLDEYLISVGVFLFTLERTIENNGTIQELVDVAETFFGHFISIVDCDNLLLASTRHVPPEDEVSRSLLDLGYHSEKYLSQERQIGYLSEKIQRQSGVEVYPPGGMFHEALVTSTMKISNQYAGYVLMLCSPDEVTPGTLDLFSLFVSRCVRLITDSDQTGYWSNSASSNLLLRLITDRGIKRSFIFEEATRLGIPISGHFFLAMLSFPEELGNQMHRLFDEVERHLLFPHGSIVHDHSIVLFIYADSMDELRAFTVQTRRMNLKKATHELFLSDSFERLRDSYFAYRQLIALKKYEPGIRTCRELTGFEGEPHIFTFSDAFCFFWEDLAADEEIRQFSSEHMLVSVLADNDKARETDDLGILFVYLANERKATVAARYCHMHRNGIIYRIERMESLYQLSLDDYLTRQYLETSLRILVNSSEDAIDLIRKFLGDERAFDQESSRLLS